MGWMATLALGPLREHLSPNEMRWLLTGGIVYTAGTVIYATERPKLWPGKFDAHDLWHIFVLAASGFHYALVMSMAVRA
jgi:hemolysin III